RPSLRLEGSLAWLLIVLASTDSACFISTYPTARPLIASSGSRVPLAGSDPGSTCVSFLPPDHHGAFESVFPPCLGWNFCCSDCAQGIA
ncbi:hypothetical protein C8T65DRAFT_608949, partial [Cerioporus squamosus]